MNDILNNPFMVDSEMTKKRLEFALAKQRQEDLENYNNAQLKNIILCDRCQDNITKQYYECSHGKWCYNCVTGTKDVGISGKMFLTNCKNKFGVKTECIYNKISYKKDE